MTSKNISWGGIVVLLIVFVGFQLIRPLISPTHNYRKNLRKVDTLSAHDILKIVADSLNKQCPLWIDSITELMNAEALINNTLQYNVALKIDRKKYDLEKLKEANEKYLMSNFVHSPYFADFSRDNITLAYNYTDTGKNFLYQILLTPDKYK